MSTHGVDRIAVILVHTADVNFRFAHFTIVGSPNARSIVNHERTVARPVAHVLVARSSILARIACAFIHVDIAVAPQRNLALSCVVCNDIIVWTQSICVSINAGAGIRMYGNLRCYENTQRSLLGQSQRKRQGKLAICMLT